MGIAFFGRAELTAKYRRGFPTLLHGPSILLSTECAVTVERRIKYRALLAMTDAVSKNVFGG